MKERSNNPGDKSDDEQRRIQGRWTRKGANWLELLVVTLVINLLAALFFPTIARPPRLSEQLPIVFVSEGLCFIRFVWAIVLLFVYRTLAERALAWLSLITSLFWLPLAGRLAFDLLVEL